MHTQSARCQQHRGKKRKRKDITQEPSSPSFPHPFNVCASRLMSSDFSPNAIAYITSVLKLRDFLTFWLVCVCVCLFPQVELVQYLVCNSCFIINFTTFEPTLLCAAACSCVQLCAVPIKFAFSILFYPTVFQRLFFYTYVFGVSHQ